MRTRARYTWMTALILLLTLIVGACGPPGGEENNEAAGSGAGAAGSEGQEGGDSASTTLNVGQISDSVGFFALYVAEEEGFFTDEGVELGSRPRLGSGAKLTAALTSGSLDIAAGVMTDAFSLAQAGRSSKVIGSLINGYYLDIVASNAFLDSAGVDQSSSLPEKVQALKDQQIGITGPGSGTEALIKYLFAQEDLDPERDATLVNLGADFSAVFATLGNDQIDALSFFWPVPQAAETRGIGQTLISPAAGDVPGMEGQTHGVVFTTEDVIAEKEDAVKGFVRAIARAEQLLTEDPDRGRELLGTYQEALDDETLDKEYESLSAVLPTTPAVDEAGFDTAVNFHEVAGLIEPGSVSYDDLVATDLISAALADMPSGGSGPTDASEAPSDR